MARPEEHYLSAERYADMAERAWADNLPEAANYFVAMGTLRAHLANARFAKRLEDVEAKIDHKALAAAINRENVRQGRRTGNG